MARLGGLIPDGVLQWSMADERTLAGRLNEVFADHDVLMTPATASRRRGSDSSGPGGRCGR